MILAGTTGTGDDTRTMLQKSEFMLTLKMDAVFVQSLDLQLVNQSSRLI